MSDTYAIEWPVRPTPRRKALWANRVAGRHRTFKETERGRARSAARRR